MGWTRRKTEVAIKYLRYGRQAKVARETGISQGRVSQIITELVNECPALASLFPRGRRRTRSIDAEDGDCIPLRYLLAA